MDARIPFLDLSAQYLEIKDHVDAAIAAVLSSARFVGGDEVEALEAAFAAFVGAGECIGVANGTDAIELALEGAGLRPGSEVIVPAHSFIATSEAVTRAGFRVVFCDIEEHGYCMDPEDARRRVTSDTTAIIPVHLYGNPAAMPEIERLARELGLWLIEDCAQAHGAVIESRRVGSIGDAAAFSFYPGKNLGAYGDAGAITTSLADFALRVRMLANHGRTSKYAHEFEGRNSRLDALQAAVLRVKLGFLEGWTTTRRRLAATYLQGLAGVGDLILPEERVGGRHVYHLFVVQTVYRDELRAFLDERGIETGIHYPTALPQLAAYRGHPQHREEFRASQMASRLLSLPLGDGLSSGQIGDVVLAIREFFSQR